MDENNEVGYPNSGKGSNSRLFREGRLKLKFGGWDPNEEVFIWEKRERKNVFQNSQNPLYGKSLQEIHTALRSKKKIGGAANELNVDEPFLSQFLKANYHVLPSKLRTMTKKRMKEEWPKCCEISFADTKESDRKPTSQDLTLRNPLLQKTLLEIYGEIKSGKTYEKVLGLFHVSSSCFSKHLKAYNTDFKALKALNKNELEQAWKACCNKLFNETDEEGRKPNFSGLRKRKRGGSGFFDTQKAKKKPTTTIVQRSP